MSKKYRVSCEELGFLYDLIKENDVTGSRIMGDGFDGCTINLLKDEVYNQFTKVLLRKFRLNVDTHLKSIWSLSVEAHIMFAK